MYTGSCGVRSLLRKKPYFGHHIKNHPYQILKKCTCPFNARHIKRFAIVILGQGIADATSTDNNNIDLSKQYILGCIIVFYRKKP